MPSLLLLFVPRTGRSEREREKLARAITEITDDPTLANQNFPVSSSLALFTIYCRQNAADFAALKKREGEGGELATQGRPLGDLGKANKCEGNRREE